MYEELTFTIADCEPSKLLDYFSHPKVLPKYFKFLTGVETVDGNSYTAEFLLMLGFIPIRFRFKQTVSRGITMVQHEGVMDRPKAWWRFTVEVPNYSDAKLTGECRVVLKGEYKGPFERFAHGPMREFLENVKSAVQANRAEIFAV